MSNTRDTLVLQSNPDTSKPVVAGIQLGATHSGATFAFKANPGSVQFGAPTTFDPTQTQVPTLLLQLDDGRWKFGYDAGSVYNELLIEAHGGADQIKGQLYKTFPSFLDNQMTGMDTLTATSVLGKKHLLMDLFVRGLGFLKDYALEKSNNSFGGFVDPIKDVQWVITVPTSWNDFGRAFLRRAAFTAGFIDSESSGNLLLAWEPDCAALAVHVGRPEIGILRTTNRFLVLDCKGEATFLTVHEVETLRPISLRAITIPAVFPVGGSYVEVEFNRFLQELLGPQLYCPNENPYEFYCVTTEFQKVMLHFDPSREPGNIRLTDLLENRSQLVELVQRYNMQHPATPVRSSPAARTGILTMSRELMLSFYEPTLHTIVAETKAALSSNVGIKHLLLVGTFADSKVVIERITREFNGKGGITVIPPGTKPTPQSAVLYGATHFGLFNYIIQTAAMCTELDRAALKTYSDQIAVLCARLNDVLLTVAAQDRALQLLVNKRKECPSLFWFYPKRRELRNWLSNPTKCLFQDTLMMMVVCPVTLSVVPCGPEGVGWELSVPKQWVKKWGPAIVFSIYLLQAAVLAGRIVGIPLPQLPSAAAITGLSSTVIGTSVNSLVNQESIMQSLTGFASTTAAEMDQPPAVHALCACVQEGKGAQQKVVDAFPKELLDDSYKSMHTFLTTGDNMQLGKLEDQLRGRMEREVAENGDVDWVSKEGRDAWLAARKLSKQPTPAPPAAPVSATSKPASSGDKSAAPAAPADSASATSLAAEDRAAIRELQATVKQLQATVLDLSQQIRDLRNGGLPAPAPAPEVKKKSGFLPFSK